MFGFWSCCFSTCVCISIAGCSWWFPCLCHSGGETSCFTSSSASPSGSDSTSHSSLPSRQKRWIATHFATKDEMLHKDMNINQNLKYRWSVTIHRRQHLAKVALTLGSQIFRWPQKISTPLSFPFIGCRIFLGPLYYCLAGFHPHFAESWDRCDEHSDHSETEKGICATKSSRKPVTSWNLYYVGKPHFQHCQWKGKRWKTGQKGSDSYPFSKDFKDHGPKKPWYNSRRDFNSVPGSNSQWISVSMKSCSGCHKETGVEGKEAEAKEERGEDDEAFDHNNDQLHLAHQVVCWRDNVMQYMRIWWCHYCTF